MLLSVVSVLVVVQPSSEVPEGLMNYPVLNADESKQRRMLVTRMAMEE